MFLPPDGEHIKLLAMRRIYLVFLTLFLGPMVMSQQIMTPCDSAAAVSYDGLDFHGKFAVKFSSDGQSNYFLIDFSRFTERFEQIYFLESSFGVKEIVNLGYYGATTPVCYKAAVQYPVGEILNKFETLLLSTRKTDLELTPAEKEQWLSAHDKYK